jgi:glyceraldehyde 3-phosphate dehydrogenase
MSIRVGITGFGRIGRLVLRASLSRKDIEIVGINATVTPDYMAYMMKYDTIHGRLAHDITNTADSIIIDGKKIPCFSSRDPVKIPWGDAGVDYLIDATGAFKTMEKASVHLQTGVKKVILTSPASDIPMFVMGVNTDKSDPSMNIVSNASCTSNCLAPVAKILNDNYGIASGLMTTVHSVTASQKTVDGKSEKDWRGGRAASYNIIPSSTGAAIAVTKVIPELKGRLTGMSLRVPTLDVSVVDLTVNLETPVKYEDVCALMKDASKNKYKEFSPIRRRRRLQRFIGDPISPSSTPKRASSHRTFLKSWLVRQRHGYSEKVWICGAYVQGRSAGAVTKQKQKSRAPARGSFDIDGRRRGSSTHSAAPLQ